MTFGIGIIGCGAISNHHAKAYVELNRDCVIRAVADLNRTKAEQLAASIGGTVSVYEDYRELLSRDDIDVVSVCTPPFAHKGPVMDALYAGKHVLVEKPFAPSLADCDEMIEASKKAGKKLVVTFQYRYRQDFNQIKHLLDQGLLEPLTFAQMNGLYWRGDKYYEVDWRGTWKSECGGVTINHAIHPLDIFLWLMGEAESVNAEMHTMAHDIEVEDLSFAVIRFKSGAVGQIACTVNSVKSDIRMEFSGKRQSVSIPLAFHAVREDERGFPIADEEGVRALTAAAQAIDSGNDDHTGPIRDLFQAIRENREPKVGGREGRRVIELITALYKSATTGERVSLPITKDDPWYTTSGLQDLVKKPAGSGGSAGAINVG